MAQVFLLCLILVNVFVAMASETAQTHQNAQAPAPYKAEAPPSIRKLGKHHAKVVKNIGGEPPATSPSEAPQAEKENHPKDHFEAIAAEPNNGEHVNVKGQAVHLEKHHHNNSFDKSMAGGGVILGGLATTFLVAVFCYIRATGRHKSSSDQSCHDHQSTTEV
ncbi:hypothetical protein CCACVL1_21144 [Corchorus capsularis]|uniref:Uncharacterized protein n=1 Tax=Corchorus capsularis TaxID=210143 RepID=A0A1R3H882_COCAP|nr:hypothetical protein CCACVL1_21144 [Corchorus capsularis]